MALPRKPKVPISSSPVNLLALAADVNMMTSSHELADNAEPTYSDVIYQEVTKLQVSVPAAETLQNEYLALENQKKAKRQERDNKLEEIADSLRLIRDAGFTEFSPNFERIGELGFQFFYGSSGSGAGEGDIPHGDATLVDDGGLNPL